jgi:hypothetical protein
MSAPKTRILTLSAALAAIAGSCAAVPADASANAPEAGSGVSQAEGRRATSDLMSLTVEGVKDTTVLAQSEPNHSSHASHASHASHSSHASHASGM